MDKIQELKEQIIQKYVVERKSFRKTAQELKLSESKVLRFLRENNLIRKIGVSKKYFCKSDFFDEIDSEEKAYWLGVLFADGNVSKTKNNAGVIKFSSIDLEWIEAFKEALHYTGNIYQEHHTKFDKIIYKIQISDEQLFQALNSLGCIPNKSLVIKFPNISSELVRHFIRGYFDGDGTVGIYNNAPKNKNKTFTLRSGFCSGSKQFLEKLAQFIPTKNKVVKTVKRKNNLYTLMFSVEDSLSLFNYFYNSASIFLSRKKLKFLEFKQVKRSTTIIDPS